MSIRTANAGQPLTAADIADNFAELHPALTDAEAVAESVRCLYCFDAPCTIACPTHIDVPGFIKKIQHDNLRGAARVILDVNPLGHSCARACPVEVLCEGACVMNEHEHRAIAIGRLQRHATDAALARGWQLFAPGAATGKKVAIVGAGPAGLACAQGLRRAGHTTVVFDARKQPGGLNTFAIAQYKLRPDTALAEAKTILDLGVELRTGVAVGTDLSFEQLERDFDAVFIGVGLGATQSLGVPGEDHGGVVDALGFIEQLKTRPYGTFAVPGRVLVIGGGNTAVDAATQAKRLGAEHVAFVYRRTEEEAPAYDFEIELARKSGCEFHWLTAPLQVLTDGGKVTGLECVKMALGKADASGRRGVSPVAGSEHVIGCDLVIKALGQTKRVELLGKIPRLQLDDAGRVVVNQQGQTTNPKFFAGGDCVNGGKEIVNAAADGKRAAAAIHAFLGYSNAVTSPSKGA